MRFKKKNKSPKCLFPGKYKDKQFKVGNWGLVEELETCYICTCIYISWSNSDLSKRCCSVHALNPDYPQWIQCTCRSHKHIILELWFWFEKNLTDIIM